MLHITDLYIGNQLSLCYSAAHIYSYVLISHVGDFDDKAICAVPLLSKRSAAFS